MGEPIFKRVANSSLPQHVGKPVTILGEVAKVESNGRMLTLNISPNSTVTVQLQEPMRALKLHPDDCELFNQNLDGEKHAFFRSHLPAFKRMWNEEGRVYWLRFLTTFKMHFECDLYHRTGSDRLMNFIFIYIHKQFVEGSYGTAKNFIENIFIAAKHFHNLPEQSFTKNPFYTKESREAFRALLGKPDLDDEIPVPVMGFVCSVYFEFIGAVCAVLKKWLQEPDLSEEVKQKVDYTLFYWRPCSDWEEQNFAAGCFEKYLASYWKDDLPKMLLTCDIHNIFNNHTTENCCDYDKDMNVFDLLKDKSGPASRFSMPHVKLLKPTVVSCGAHNNCRLKVLHDDNCLEPYLCEGKALCIVTCEVTSKRRNQNKELNRANPWKKLIIETFASKDANRRTVCTQVQSDSVQIETYLHEKDSEMKECAEAISDEFLCLHDAELRNAFNQHKRKEQLKNRLRSKLSKKYVNFDPKDYEDPEFCWALYEQAQQAWICDMCEGNLQEVMSGKSNEPDIEKHNTKSFSKVRRALTSVAVGTGDIVIGRVVNPSTLPNSQSHVNSSDSREKGDAKPKSKKSKSKKKKGNVNGSSGNNTQSDSTCRNSESIPGGSVYLDSELKTNVQMKSTSVMSNPKSCDKPLGLNANHSNSFENNIDAKSTTNELKSTIKPLTSVKTESSKEMVENESLSNKNINSDSVRTDNNNKCSIEKNETAVTNRVPENVNEGLINKLQDIGKTDVPSQGKTAAGSNDDTVNSNASNEINVVCENASALEKEKYALKEVIESGNMTVNDAHDSVPKTDTLIKNEVLDTADNDIPEFFGNVDSTDDTTVDEFLKLIGVLKPVEKVAESDTNSQEPVNIQAKEVESTENKLKLRTCAFCGKKEVQVKSFKRCARCKIEKFVQQRYYCSRSCQLEDWEESHRDEHSRKAEQL